MPSHGVDDGLFRRSVLVWLVAVAASSLALGVATLVLRPAPSAVESSGADSFSRSALGHRGFVELLRATSVPVLVSRHASADRARSGLLLLAEPHLGGRGSPRAARLGAMLEVAPAVLLVLPKWSARAHATERGWVSAVELLPLDTVSEVLGAAGVETAPVRTRGGYDGSCSGTAARFAARIGQFLERSGAVRPLVECGGLTLLGEVARESGDPLLVLSDPDLIANHGLGRGDNAALALDVVAYGRRDGAPVIVDETLHGHERIPSLWAELLAGPLLAPATQAALVALALVWAGMIRFGAPLPPPAAHASGKTVLIENTASLMGSAGHSAHALGRYFEATLLEVARRLHVPPGEARRPLLNRLRRIGRLRGVRSDVVALESEIERVRGAALPTTEGLIDAARRVHRWKEEMLRGPRDDSRRR